VYNTGMEGGNSDHPCSAQPSHQESWAISLRILFQIWEWQQMQGYICSTGVPMFHLSSSALKYRLVS